jgi:hypothetical protein
MGMNVAQASDITVDIDIPKECILDHDLALADFYPVTYFHKYGTLTNHLGVCQELLTQIIKICDKNQYELKFELAKI